MREQAAAQQFEHARLHSPCTVLAMEIGNPTEILDTPKEILIIPRVFQNTPKVTTVLKIKTFKNYGIGIEFDKEHE